MSKSWQEATRDEYYEAIMDGNYLLARDIIRNNPSLFTKEEFLRTVQRLQNLFRKLSRDPDVLSASPDRSLIQLLKKG